MTATPFALTFGDRLRKVREARGQSLRDVQIDTSGKWTIAMVGSWERAGRNATVARANDLCEYYGIPLREVLDPSPLVSAAFVSITRSAAPAEKERIRRLLIAEAEKPCWDSEWNGVLVI